jgi:hypothetical protein
MGRLGDIRKLLGGRDTDAAYECLACNSRFDRQYQVCPECNGYDISHTEWLDGQQDDVWTALVSASDDERIEQLYRDWRAVHTDFEIIPVSINLLKYQGQKQRSLSEIVLSHAHQNPHLTGVDDGISEGLSPQIEVAYFEKWFRTTDAWADRQTS